MKTSLKGFKIVAISSAVRVIRRACLAARLKMHAFLSFFFFRACSPKGESWSCSWRRPWKLGIRIATWPTTCSERHACFVKKAYERLMLKMFSGFSETGRYTNSVAWKRWLLWKKWILHWSKKEESLWAKRRCPLASMTFSLPSLFLFTKFRKFTITAPRELKDFPVVLPDNVPNMWIKHSTENARSDKY